MINYKIGDSGCDTIQQLLIEAGLIISPQELSMATFGQSTYAAVRQFQAQHGLSEDGIVGPHTYAALMNPNGNTGLPVGWRCEPSQARSDIQPVLHAAIGELGVKEGPVANRGDRVDIYTGMVGQDPKLEGPAWCALFLSWLYKNCPQAKMGTIASSYKMIEWGKANNKLVSGTMDILPGDVFCILRAAFHGHVGLIVHAYGDGTIASIEGNSGNAVAGRIRPLSTFSAIVRPLPIP